MDFEWVIAYGWNWNGSSDMDLEWSRPMDGIGMGHLAWTWNGSSGGSHYIYIYTLAESYRQQTRNWVGQAVWQCRQGDSGRAVKVVR